MKSECRVKTTLHPLFTLVFCLLSIRYRPRVKSEECFANFSFNGKSPRRPCLVKVQTQRAAMANAPLCLGRHSTERLRSWQGVIARTKQTKKIWPALSLFCLFSLLIYNFFINLCSNPRRLGCKHMPRWLSEEKHVRAGVLYIIKSVYLALCSWLIETSQLSITVTDNAAVNAHGYGIFVLQVSHRSPHRLPM